MTKTTELYTPADEVYDQDRIVSEGRLTVRDLRATFANPYFDDKLDMPAVALFFPNIDEADHNHKLEIVDISTLVDRDGVSNERLVFAVAQGEFEGN